MPVTGARRQWRGKTGAPISEIVGRFDADISDEIVEPSKASLRHACRNGVGNVAHDLDPSADLLAHVRVS